MEFDEWMGSFVSGVEDVDQGEVGGDLELLRRSFVEVWRRENVERVDFSGEGNGRF